MKFVLKFVLAVLLLFTNAMVFAQDRLEDDGDYYVEDEYAFEWLIGRDFKPFIQAELGAGIFDHINLPLDYFNPQPLGEIRIGYSEHWQARKMIPLLDERYINAGFGLSDIEELQPDSNLVNSKIGRIGVGNRLGYGYKLGPLALIPYHQIEVNAIHVDFTAPKSLSTEQLDILSRYPGQFHLNLSYGGGVKVDLFHALSANASYETSIVYPRWLFLQWLGSFIIQELGMGVATYFGDDLVEAAPLFGPLLYWGIKNGLSLLYFSQVRQHMNWPFASESPMTNVTFKLGAQLTF